jgi:hypothetical protein
MDILAAHGLEMVVATAVMAKVAGRMQIAAAVVQVVILEMVEMVNLVIPDRLEMAKAVAVADQWLTQVDTLAAAVGSAFMDKAQMESAA